MTGNVEEDAVVEPSGQRPGTRVTMQQVAAEAGYTDQPHLTRSLQELVGYTPGEVARGDMFLDL